MVELGPCRRAGARSAPARERDPWRSASDSGRRGAGPHRRPRPVRHPRRVRGARDLDDHADVAARPRTAWSSTAGSFRPSSSPRSSASSSSAASSIGGGLRIPFAIGIALFAIGMAHRGPRALHGGARRGAFPPGLRGGAIPPTSYAAIGRTLPKLLRPPMFATLATAWVIPGLLGPAIAGVGRRLPRVARGVPGPAAADRGLGGHRLPSDRPLGLGAPRPQSARRCAAAPARHRGRRRHGAPARWALERTARVLVVLTAIGAAIAILALGRLTRRAPCARARTARGDPRSAASSRSRSSRLMPTSRSPWSTARAEHDRSGAWPDGRDARLDGRFLDAGAPCVGSRPSASCRPASPCSTLAARRSCSSCSPSSAVAGPPHRRPRRLRHRTVLLAALADRPREAPGADRGGASSASNSPTCSGPPLGLASRARPWPPPFGTPGHRSVPLVAFASGSGLRCSGLVLVSRPRRPVREPLASPVRPPAPAPATAVRLGRLSAGAASRRPHRPTGAHPAPIPARSEVPPDVRRGPPRADPRDPRLPEAGHPLLRHHDPSEGPRRRTGRRST